VRLRNVEGLVAAVVDDVSDAVLLPNVAIGVLNQRILAAGSVKLQILREILAFKRIIRTVAWQTEVLQRQTAVALLRYQHLHTLRVTKQMQAVVVRHAAEAAAAGAAARKARAAGLTKRPAADGTAGDATKRGPKGAKKTAAAAGETTTNVLAITAGGAKAVASAQQASAAAASAAASAGEYNRREREQLRIKIEASEQSLASRVAEKKGIVRKYFMRVQTRRAENDELQAAVVRCASLVGQRAGIAVLQSDKTELARGLKVLRALRCYRNLEMVAKAQVDEIAVLRAQVAKLRARTFPAFAVVTKRAIGPDERE
jgi:hypothetical protein